MAKNDEPQPTARKTGENSRGEPTVYPSDVESVSTSYNLTGPEAERLILGGKVNDKEADKIKGERVVYRPHYELVTNPSSNPLVLADQRRAAQEEQTEADRKAAADRIATDKTSPESGPYGPNVAYTESEAPVDTDHTSPRNPEEVKS